MKAEAPKATMIRSGYYETNIKCHCGGQIFIERAGTGEVLWESFCANCLSCDCNGWPTLADALAMAPAYFATK